MHFPRFALVAAAALAVSGVRAQIIEPGTAAEKALVESVQKRLSPCFTMMGANRAMPVAANRPPDKELLAAVLLPASGPLVHDGYNYMLLIHGRSNAAFVVQSGGFAGSRVVFGPVPLSTSCE